MIKSTVVLICWVIYTLLFVPATGIRGRYFFFVVILFMVLFQSIGCLLASRYSQRYILPLIYGLVMGTLFAKLNFAHQTAALRRSMANDAIFWQIIIEMIAMTLGTCLLCVFVWSVGQKRYWRKEVIEKLPES